MIHSRFAAALLLAALTASASANEIVRVDASAAAVSLARLAAAEFNKQKTGGAQVGTALSGTSGAFARLCRGEVALALVSRPILNDEAEICGKAKVGFVELPVAFDAIAIIVNPRNTFADSFTAADLRRIWEPAAQGTLTQWKQVNPRWPDLPLRLRGPDRASDDGSYFNAAILGNPFAREDYMSSSDDAVLIQGVARDVNGLAYVSLAAYSANRSLVRAVPLAGRTGAAGVLPSAGAVLNGAYQPLARPLFLYVNAASLDMPGTRAFAEFLAANGARLARAADLVPLTDATYQTNTVRLRSRSKGTLWAGTVPVGMTVEALQKKQAM